jgi:hypothetical protein
VVPNQHCQEVVANTNKFQQQLVIIANIFGDLDECQYALMQVLTFDETLMQAMILFAFGEDLSKPVLRGQFFVIDRERLPFDLALLQTLVEVVQVLDDARLLGVNTGLPDDDVVVALVIECDAKHIVVAKSQELSTRNSAFDAESVGEPTGDYEDFFEILYQFTTLTVYAVE